MADKISDEKFDIVFLSETWFKEVGYEPRIAEMTPKGFLLTNIPRRTGRGGGLVVLYRDSLTRHLNIRHDFALFKTFEM